MHPSSVIRAPGAPTGEAAQAASAAAAAGGHWFGGGGGGGVEGERRNLNWNSVELRSKLINNDNVFPVGGGSGGGGDFGQALVKSEQHISDNSPPQLTATTTSCGSFRSDDSCSPTDEFDEFGNQQQQQDFVSCGVSSSAGLSAMTLSNITTASGEASVSSGARGDANTGAVVLSAGPQPIASAAPATPTTTSNSTATGQIPLKRKRNLPGTPDPDAEVIALSPKTLMATNRFVCEICNKGFQRDQNLQLHRRGHNLPWKLRQRTSKEIRKRVYICPEASCVHHDPSRALGDLTGIKKHFCRKHGEKKWKCDKCSKRYAVQSDWKAHSKTCGTREYRCDCGTLFSRRDSFITHRAFCDALAEESARVSAGKPGQAPGGEHNLGGGPSAGGISAIGAPCSPRSANVAMRGQMDPHSVNAVSRTGLGIGEGGLAMIQGSWPSGGRGSGPTTPGSGTRLSLWSGPGPGPPGLVGSSQLNTGGNPQMNPMDGNYLMQAPKMQPSLMGSSNDYDMPRPSSGLMQLPASSSPGQGLFNYLTNGNGMGNQQQQQGSGVAMQAGNPGIGGISATYSDFTGVGASGRFERGSSGSAMLSLSSSAGMTSSSSTATNGGGTASALSSILNQHPQMSTSQMSATALLQKAAQMSSTSSNSPLLRNFGMGGQGGGGGQGGQVGGGNESNSIPSGALWQGPNRQDQGRAASLPPITSVMGASGLQSNNNNMMRRPGDPTPGPGSQGLGSPLMPPAYGSGQGNRPNEDYMNSLTQYTRNMSTMSPMYPGSMSTPGSLGGMMTPNVVLQRQHQIPSSDNMGSRQQLNSHQQFGGSQGLSSSMLAGLGKKGSEDGGDRMTRDFLGVGATTNLPGRTLSQRELQVAGIPPLGQQVDMGFGSQPRSVGASGQHSPEKSWEGP